MKGLSQKEFAQKINARNTTVSNWERGIARPDVDMLALICGALDVSADELLDIRLSQEVYSEKEKHVIEQYRKKRSMQAAVQVLLGLEDAPQD